MTDGKFRELDRDVELAAHAHQRLLAALDAAVEAGDVDVAAPSRLPGWTRGHVLTHVINSGRGHAGILEGAARGEVVAQYPHGLEGRAADIESGASRPLAEQRDDLRRSVYELEALYAASTWRGSGEAPFGPVVLTDLPFYRVREVAIHHVDLDIGYEFDDLPSLYVQLELDALTNRWVERQPARRDTDDPPSDVLPPPVAALSPSLRLAWLLGRRAVDGVEPAGAL